MNIIVTLIPLQIEILINSKKHLEEARIPLFMYNKNRSSRYSTKKEIR